ncbi:hypothetical protein OROMI_007785 [Orobanche minor]
MAGGVMACDASCFEAILEKRIALVLSHFEDQYFLSHLWFTTLQTRACIVLEECMLFLRSL